MRAAARVDHNQAAIVSALRQVGAMVCILSSVGRGCPDLLVGYHGMNYLLEVKAEKGRLTRQETEWIQTWAGQVRIVRSVIGACAAIGIQV